MSFQDYDSKGIKHDGIGHQNEDETGNGNPRRHWINQSRGVDNFKWKQSGKLIVFWILVFWKESRLTRTARKMKSINPTNREFYW